MAPAFENIMLTSIPYQSLSDNETLTIQNMVSVTSISQNTSSPDGCMAVKLSEMGYLPWDNPDNIVSADVEIITSRVKDNMLVFLFLIGGPANVINMAVFYKQGLKDRVNLCLFALSLMDELYLLVLMLLQAEQLHLQFTTQERYGPMFTFLLNINFSGFMGFFSVSPVLSAIIAMDRCYCVLRPLKFHNLLTTRSMAAVIVVVTALVLGLFFILAFRFRVACLYDLDSRVAFKTLIVGDFYLQHKELIDILEGYVFGLGLPGVVLTAVITSTIITVVKLRQIVTWRAGISSSLSTREIALTKMLVGNSILFIACVLPVALVRFIWLFFPEMNSGRRHHNFYLTCLWAIQMCTFINATFNFFVYYAMGSRYREMFWALFRSK